MKLLSEAFERIEEAALRQMEQDSIPGMALTVTDQNGIVFERYFGYSSLEAREPVRDDHLFEIGSIGKSFTCILLLQLAEEGRLSLHDPLAMHLPWFEIRSDFEPITLHHLMTHTAGIITGTDFPADPRYEVFALRETRAVNPPGEHFHYSNVGYKALGMVLERVAGQSYGELVQERILDPLGMHTTHPVITHHTRCRMATGYQHFYDDRPWQPSHGHAPAAWLETNTADGCIASTTRDLATYLRMLMNGEAGSDQLILSQESYCEMTTPYIETGENGSYGLGLRLETRESREFVGHNGGMVGYYASMRFDRSTGYGIVTMINGPGDQVPVVNLSLDALHASVNGLPLPEVAPLKSPFSTPHAADYAQTYSSDDGVLQILSIGQGICLNAGDEVVPLETDSEDTFLAAHQDFALFPLRFTRDDNGTVIGACHGERVWLASGGTHRVKPIPPEWEAFRGHYRTHNPWLSNFRVITRGDELLFVWPGGQEAALSPAADGSFQIGGERSPEFVRFDTVVDGRAWRANLSGCDYYRFFTP